jgi:hypothetical protein
MDILKPAVVTVTRTAIRMRRVVRNKASAAYNATP